MGGVFLRPGDVSTRLQKSWRRKGNPRELGVLAPQAKILKVLASFWTISRHFWTHFSFRMHYFQFVFDFRIYFWRQVHIFRIGQLDFGVPVFPELVSDPHPGPANHCVFIRVLDSCIGFSAFPKTFWYYLQITACSCDNGEFMSPEIMARVSKSKHENNTVDKRAVAKIKRIRVSKFWRQKRHLYAGRSRNQIGPKSSRVVKFKQTLLTLCLRSHASTLRKILRTSCHCLLFHFARTRGIMSSVILVQFSHAKT